MIVLHERSRDAGACQYVLAIGFHEEAARVFEDSRLDQQYTREAEVSMISKFVSSRDSCGHAQLSQE